MRFRSLIVLLLATGCLSTTDIERIGTAPLREPRRIHVAFFPDEPTRDAVLAELKRAFPKAEFCERACDADWWIDYQRSELAGAATQQYYGWTAIIRTRDGGNAALIHGSNHKLFPSPARPLAKAIRSLLER